METLKKQIAADIIKFVEPIYERIQELSGDSDYLQKVAKMGAEKAKESAQKTVKEVREIIGFKKF
jgi:tryptophanyl-tRNA synthetase